MEPEATRYKNLLAIVDGTVSHKDGIYSIFGPSGVVIGKGRTVDGALAAVLVAKLEVAGNRESKAVETLANSRRSAFIEAHNIYAVSAPESARAKARAFLAELQASDSEGSW